MDLDINTSDNLDTTYRFLSNSRGKRGEDSRGIGVVSIGYMWYDMDRSLFLDLAMVQDLVSFCVKQKATAVRSDSLSLRVVKILIANGFSVYDVRATLKETDRETPGYYITGVRSSVRFLDLGVEAPIVTGRMIDYKTIKNKLEVLSKGKGMSISYFYLHPELESCGLQLFPSFRVHSGLVLVSNLKRKEKTPSEVFQKLVSRFYEANYVRNLFPFSRITFAPLDPYFTYFRSSVVIPRNIPRMLGEENIISVKSYSVQERSEFQLDSFMVEQVEIEGEDSALYELFRAAFDSCTDDERTAHFSSFYNYPKECVTLEAFINYKSYNSSYSVKADQAFRDKYGFLYKDMEERKVVEKKDDIVIPNTPVADLGLVLSDAPETEEVDDEPPLDVVGKKTVKVH